MEEQNQSSKMYFAVLNGRRCGVYTSRQEAEEQTDYYPDGYYESHESLAAADKAIEDFFMCNQETIIKNQ